MIVAMQYLSNRFGALLFLHHSSAQLSHYFPPITIFWQFEYCLKEYIILIARKYGLGSSMSNKGRSIEFLQMQICQL